MLRSHAPRSRCGPLMRAAIAWAQRSCAMENHSRRLGFRLLAKGWLNRLSVDTWFARRPQKTQEQMSDDRRKRDKRDRSRIAGGQAYQVSYFARKHGLTWERVARLERQSLAARLEIMSFTSATARSQS
jgi:hypothetical protein